MEPQDTRKSSVSANTWLKSVFVGGLAIGSLGSLAACGDEAPATVRTPLTAVCVDDGMVLATSDWICGDERILECNGHAGTYVDAAHIYVSVDVAGADVCGDVDLVVTSDGPFPVGDNTVVIYDHTPDGDVLVCDSRVVVVDTTPPDVVVHDVVLWPPNHKMHDVVPEDCLDVVDACDPDVAVWFTGAASDEPVEGLGDGNTEPDIIDAGDGVVQVRSERSGTGNGRVYTLDWRAEDRWGNFVDGVCHVAVPHDNAKDWVLDGDAYSIVVTAD